MKRSSATLSAVQGGWRPAIRAVSKLFERNSTRNTLKRLDHAFPGKRGKTEIHEIRVFIDLSPQKPALFPLSVSPSTSQLRLAEAASVTFCCCSSPRVERDKRPHQLGFILCFQPNTGRDKENMYFSSNFHRDAGSNDNVGCFYPSMRPYGTITRVRRLKGTSWR